jgi:hypothetical protein
MRALLSHSHAIPSGNPRVQLVLLTLACLFAVTLPRADCSSPTLLAVGHSVRNSQILGDLRAHLDFGVLAFDGSKKQRKSTDDDGDASSDVIATMYDLTGEPFECAYVDDDGSSHSTTSRDRRRVVPVSKVTVESVTAVLDAVKDDCQVIKRGYWSYEWCHNKHVRQFHVDGGEVTADWSLGVFTNASLSTSPVDAAARRAGSGIGADDVSSTSPGVHISSVSSSLPNSDTNAGGKLGSSSSSGAEQTRQKRQGGKHGGKNQHRPTYLRQSFDGGQHCDETKGPRRTEARLFCCPSAETKGVTGAPISSHPSTVNFLEVEEVAVCEYVITLCSPMLCEAGLYMAEPLDAWEALRPLSGMCLFFHMEWWSYEFCFEQKMRQFHTSTNKVGKQENGLPSAQSVTDDFLLGKFDALATPEQLRDEVIADFVLDPGATTPLFRDEGPEPAIVQVYAGGSPCELSGQQRQTYVRYVCRPNDKASRILSIDEAATCRYNVVVNTPFLCKHSLFQKKQPQAETVRCRSVRDIDDEKIAAMEAETAAAGSIVDE